MVYTCVIEFIDRTPHLSHLLFKYTPHACHSNNAHIVVQCYKCAAEQTAVKTGNVKVYTHNILLINIFSCICCSRIRFFDKFY